jgi:hypothetical protein
MLSNFKVNRIHVRIVDAVIGINFHVESVLSFCDFNAISTFTRTFVRTIITYHLHLKKDIALQYMICLTLKLTFLQPRFNSFSTFRAAALSIPRAGISLLLVG